MKVINRIKKTEEFVFTVKNGKVLKETPYLIHYKSNELSTCRVGLSVSKRIGNAVTLIDYSSHTFDIVIIVKSEFLNLTFDENKNKLNILLSKIGITK